MQDRKYLLSIAQLSESDLIKKQELTKQCLKWLDSERLERLKRLLKVEPNQNLQGLVSGIHKSRKAVEQIGAGMLLQLAVMQVESEKGAVEDEDMQVLCGTELIQLTLSELLNGLERLASKALPLEYTYGQNGKPYLKDYPYYFNLSHSGEYIFCVISEHEVGVDIQQEKPLKDDRIARRFFTDEENQALAACTSKQERQKLFYRLWACKEAYGKLTGQGVAAVLGTSMEMQAREYNIQEYEIEDYQIAVCKWKQES